VALRPLGAGSSRAVKQPRAGRPKPRKTCFRTFIHLWVSVSAAKLSRIRKDIGLLLTTVMGVWGNKWRRTMKMKAK
jgi:hypothetical protein